MTNPWDIPPLPIRGDDIEDRTYIGVGRVMTQWECAEFDLARLYSLFVGTPDDHGALQAYGTGRIFRDRLDATKRAADQFFVRRPDQHLEGDFLKIEAYTQGYSARRNDIAHGVVFKISNLTFFHQRLSPDAQGKPQYAVIPPLHTLRRYDDNGFPTYAYTSVELQNLADDLVVLGHDIAEYRRWLSQ